MALDSEAIWSALHSRLQSSLASLASDVASVERRRKAQYTDAQLPAVVLSDDEGTEDLASDPDAPDPVWRLSGVIDVYARAKETDTSPTTQLNDLVTAVRAALEFDPALDAVQFGRVVEHYTTLGGLVRTLAITRVEKGMGALTGKPTAQLTITMEAPEGR